MSVSQTDRDFNQIQKNLERVNTMVAVDTMKRLPTPAPENERVAE